MAAIRPFAGLRYSASAGRLDSLVAPPYDVLTPAERNGYAARNPYNIVHLTLPPSEPDDRSKFVKYGRSAAALAEWRRQEILVPEGRPAIYRYTQRFSIQGEPAVYTRSSFITLLRLEPFEAGVVLPHEQTFPKHKEDRLRILEATRAHLETIFGLYEDPESEVSEVLRKAPLCDEVSTTSDDGIQQKLVAIEDPATIRHVAGLLVDKKIWIADGHHRYETALAFRQALGKRDGEVPEDFIPIALTSMSDPGLVLLPTHRIIPKFPLSREEVLLRLATTFDVQETHSSRVAIEIGRISSGGHRAFGVVFEGGLGYILTPQDEETLLMGHETQDSGALQGLDVSVLHNLILADLLGLTSSEDIEYTRDLHQAVRAVDEGAFMGWIMNPPTVQDMKTIALGGERMPQKSTYYFPKVQSGLVLWSLNDF